MNDTDNYVNTRSQKWAQKALESISKINSCFEKTILWTVIENTQLRKFHCVKQDFLFTLNDSSKLISFIVASNFPYEHTESKVAIVNMTASLAEELCKDLNDSSFCFSVSMNASSKKWI